MLHFQRLTNKRTDFYTDIIDIGSSPAQQGCCAVSEIGRAKYRTFFTKLITVVLILKKYIENLKEIFDETSFEFSLIQTESICPLFFNYERNYLNFEPILKQST